MNPRNKTVISPDNGPADETSPETKKIVDITDLEQMINNEEQLKQFIASSVSDDKPTKQDTLPREQANKIIALFAEKSECSSQEALMGITALVQSGGTNASIPPYTRTINGKKFELKTLRDIVSFVTDKKGTVRQLAKTLRDLIYKIALANSWLGPLSKTLQAEYPEKQFSPADLVGAAEFHEDNSSPYITETLRAALRDRSQKMQALRAQKPKTKKAGKKNKSQKK